VDPVAKRLRNAFTLVELLIVIGIIALLLALLLTSASAARNQANRLHCAANLRAVGQVMFVYAADNRGLVPRDYLYEENYLAGHIFWGEAFGPYFNKSFPSLHPDISIARDDRLGPACEKIVSYQCPANPNPDQPVDFVSNGWMIGAPSALSGSSPLVNVGRIRNSSAIIFLTEANMWLDTTRFFVYDVSKPDHLPPSSGSRVLDDLRHRGLINMLFFDGHVHAAPFTDISPRDFRGQD
jgi:prepilin-type N-terminal cleavage/methylation domain-containing protein/prepilin-type processing-associated H-X9-DG protein